MAITVVDSNFGTLTIPGAYSRINVNTPASGLSSFGVVTIIGEADSGPGTAASTENIENNFYTPAQLGAVITKYGTGRIVDAFKALCAPSNDPNISGALTRIYIYKTNLSAAASANISTLNSSFTAYGQYSASLAGALGNQLAWNFVTAQTPVDDTTGLVSYIPVPTNGTSAGFTYRLSGGSSAAVVISANQATTTVAANATSANFLAVGGTNRNAASGLTGVTCTVVVSGTNATFQLAGNNVFATSPVAGDLMVLPNNSLYGSSVTSTLAGASSANLGAWVLTAVSNSTGSAILTATKMADNVNITVANPANVTATFSASPSNDMVVYSPLQFIDKTSTNRLSFSNLNSATVSITVTGAVAQFNFTAGGFSGGLALPQVNDNLYVPSGSYLSGAASANVGWYTVTTVNNVTGSAYVSASRLSNGNPVNLSATAVSSAINNDLQVLRPWVDGYEKTLEVSDTGLTTALSKSLLNLGTTAAYSGISSAAAPVVEVATGLKITAGITRSVDNTNESYVSIGDNVVLELGYFGTTASVVVGSTSMIFTVTGGSGANQTLTFSNYSTVSALVTAINTLTGYSAQVASTAVGLLPPSVLDQGTYNLCSSVANTSYPCLIKKDAYDFVTALSGSPTTSFKQIAFSGLPNPASASFLSGGAKNGSSGAQFTAGFDACQAINTNFVVPLIAQDASLDIPLGYTDPSSTYTVNAINAYANTHCVFMSTPQQRKNRLAVVCARGSFANALTQASAIASSRTALMFQDVKAVNSLGNIFQFQGWYGACVAAGMQAIGLYKSIMRKYANVSGIVSPNNDFSPNNQGQLTQALNGGLLLLQAPTTGGFRFVSDQTSYGKDANWVYNSLQVMYTVDYMAVDLANSFDNFAVGQPITTVTAPVALTFLKSKMTQYLQNQLIASSTNAPAGYDSATISLNGPVMQVGVNAYPTNAIYFVLITFNVTQASSTASSS